jgi:predicted nucleic acid-binding protein
VVPSFVIDGSVALAGTLPDERSSRSTELLNRVAEQSASAPPIWPFEVANGLLQAFRRGRISDAYRVQRLREFSRLPIVIDPADHQLAWTGISRLAASHGLTVYDASYLELAIRSSLPLATLDRALAAAARHEHVAVL